VPAPGVTDRWTNRHAYADEVSAVRIAAAFHYQFSTVEGAFFVPGSECRFRIGSTEEAASVAGRPAG
jgi:hypothetical protein